MVSLYFNPILTSLCHGPHCVPSGSKACRLYSEVAFIIIISWPRILVEFMLFSSSENKESLSKVYYFSSDKYNAKTQKTIFCDLQSTLAEKKETHFETLKKPIINKNIFCKTQIMFLFHSVFLFQIF